MNKLCPLDGTDVAHVSLQDTRMICYICWYTIVCADQEKEVFYCFGLISGIHHHFLKS